MNLIRFLFLFLNFICISEVLGHLKPVYPHELRDSLVSKRVLNHKFDFVFHFIFELHLH
jgi:hypothetical protein